MSIKEKKYILIKNFLDEKQKNLLFHYCRIKHLNNTTSFDTVQNNNFDTHFHGDPLTDSLLLTKRKIIEKESGLELLPTYSFWRMYSYGSDLKKHTDRESCEISVTFNIAADVLWPIYMGGKAVFLEPGDGVIYLGCEVEHWREPFEGDYSAQCFLHYVDKNGPNTEWYRDKRRYIGEPK